MMEFKDYYEVLGVAKDAAQDAIKKTYRKLAVQFHPDKNPGDKKSEERFKEITEAYEVLGDPEKRRKYDEMREQWKNYRQGGGRSDEFDWSAWSGGQGGGEGGGYTYTFDGDDVGGFSEFFESVFGGGRARGNGKHRVRNMAFRGEDLRAEMQVSLEEAFSGTTRRVQLGEQLLDLKVKPGVRDGQVLRLKGKGGQGVNGGPNGDLLITVLVEKNPRFRREGDDLYTEAAADLYTAILGGKTEVQTPKGPVRITLAPGTQNAKTLRLKGMGMPAYDRPGVAGDLYVKLNIRLPEKLSAEEKELFERLASLRRHNVKAGSHEDR